MTAHEVAKYFLSLTDDDAGDLISNLKLQKLLYYAQGFTLAITGAPLFTAPIEAWAHGPVVPSVYHRFKGFGSNPIPPQGPIDLESIDAGTLEILQEVYEVYGQFSAWKLRNMTHEEPPWRDASVGSTISHESLKSYFEQQLVS